MKPVRKKTKSGEVLTVPTQRNSVQKFRERGKSQTPETIKSDDIQETPENVDKKKYVLNFLNTLTDTNKPKPADCNKKKKIEKP